MRIRNASPPTQANNAARAPKISPPTRARYMHLTKTPDMHHLVPPRHQAQISQHGTPLRAQQEPAQRTHDCHGTLLVVLRFGQFGVAFFTPLQCAVGAPCCCWLRWALLVCYCSVLLVRARGPALRLGVCFLGFPAIVFAATTIPTIASFCNTLVRKVRSSKKSQHTHTGQQQSMSRQWQPQPRHPTNDSRDTLSQK